MEGKTILVLEDDPLLNQQLSDLLTAQGYTVEQSHDGDEGLTMALQQPYHLILLDVMLPKLDGFSVLNRLRQSRQTPVMMLTAKGAEEERIRGFSRGVDDYLAKPFNTTELMLRIEAILRRCYPSVDTHQTSPAKQPATLNLDELSMNRQQQIAHIGHLEVELTPTQFKLLWTLLLHKGEVLNKAFLYQTVLNRTFGAHDRSLDMHLSRVRRKLNDVGWRGERLQAVHGKGYCLS